MCVCVYNFNLCIVNLCIFSAGLFWWLSGKESNCNARDMGSIPGSGNSLEKEMATCCNILPWGIPWTEEPGGLQSMGLKESDMTSHTHTIMEVIGYQYEDTCAL